MQKVFKLLFSRAIKCMVITYEYVFHFSFDLFWFFYEPYQHMNVNNAQATIGLNLLY